MTTNTHPDAKAALRAMGIAPTRDLIRQWIQAAEAEQPVPAVEVPKAIQLSQTKAAEAEMPDLPAAKLGRSRSRLLEAGIACPDRKGKPGRPRIVASWFPAVAETMQDGASLKMALAMNGIHGLSPSETRALYRNRTFKALYQEARRRWFLENWGRRPSLRARLGRYV